MTLGAVDNVELIKVNAEERALYDQSFALQKGGLDALSGVVTGGLGNAGKLGKVVNAVDKLNDVADRTRNVVDIGQAAMEGDLTKLAEKAATSLAQKKLADTLGRKSDATGAAQTGKTPGSATTTTRTPEGTLPNEALVVKGGLSKNSRIDTFEEPGRGRVTGTSASSEPGKTVTELSERIKHDKVRTSTVGAIRHAGGDVIPTRRTADNPYHATITGLDPEQIDKVLDMPPIPNPSKARD